MQTKQTESQKQAVMHGEGPAMVLAGPGSGKTLVITKRIEYLIKERRIAPEEILVITFTKAAAVEMRERFERLMGGCRQGVTFGTFHSVFFRILKASYNLSADNIIREDQRLNLLGSLIEEARLSYEDQREMIDGLSGEISQIKNERIDPEHFYSGVCGASTFRDIYQKYIKKMREMKLLDFDDMLLYTWQLLAKREDILQFWQKKYRYILVDEFQDINALQYEIVQMLAQPENNLFVVGDDDQSIYRFRGAKPEIMLGFRKAYPDGRILYLKENFRCSRRIVEAAGQIISENQSRYDKEITCQRGSGDRIDMRQIPTAAAEALYIIRRIRLSIEEGRSPDEIAVLTRTNTGGRYLAEKLMEFEIPFRMDDIVPNLYDHWISRDILAYMRMAAGPIERSDFFRVMNKPLRYLSRDCVDSPRVDFNRLAVWYEDKPWMQKRLDTLEDDLQIIRAVRPYAAINYIRSGVGYEGYLKEYARERRIKEDELMEVLMELQERSREFDTFAAWQAHIDHYREQLQQQKKNRFEDKDETPRITLSTLHAAKGLEYEEVFLPDVNEEVLPHKKSVLDADIEEERRLLYVGMTRAKDQLHILWVKDHHGRQMDPSRFLDVLL